MAKENGSKQIEKMPEGMEVRILAADDIELRVSDDEKPKITGYAAKYGKWSLDLGGFTERIRAGAFDEALEKCDVRALKNHDPNLLLGRSSSGTLRLETNSVGLGFEIDPPDTNTGRDTVEEIRRKDITGCSFAFTILEEDWKFCEDDTIQRTIIKVDELFDVGPVTYPAYPDTTVAARSLDEFKKRKLEVENQNEEERKKKYTCECIECGETLETNDHCKDIKCPECGGEMRRKERPGPGRSQDKEEGKTEISAERRREIERKYRHSGRIIARCRPAEV